VFIGWFFCTNLLLLLGNPCGSLKVLTKPFMNLLLEVLISSNWGIGSLTGVTGICWFGDAAKF
jgi:hypothetical protein